MSELHACTPAPWPSRCTVPAHRSSCHRTLSFCNLESSRCQHNPQSVFSWKIVYRKSVKIPRDLLYLRPRVTFAPARQRLDPHNVPCLHTKVPVIKPCQFASLSPKQVNIICKVLFSCGIAYVLAAPLAGMEEKVSNKHWDLLHLRPWVTFSPARQRIDPHNVPRLRTTAAVIKSICLLVWVLNMST